MRTYLVLGLVFHVKKGSKFPPLIQETKESQRFFFFSPFHLDRQIDYRCPNSGSGSPSSGYSRLYGMVDQYLTSIRFEV